MRNLCRTFVLLMNVTAIEPQEDIKEKVENTGMVLRTEDLVKKYRQRTVVNLYDNRSCSAQRGTHISQRT